jgi:nucleotide-binding universal stress UspA family protein
MYGRILVPIDGSEASRRGLNEAMRLAKIHGSQLRLVHVVNEFILDITYSAGLYPQNLIESLREGGKALLDGAQAAAQAAGVNAEGVLLESIGGVPADFILAQAKEWKADLIVMGTHGRRGLLRLTLGSNADLVVRGATVPVILIRANPHTKNETAVHIAPARGRVGCDLLRSGGIRSTVGFQPFKLPLSVLIRHMEGVSAFCVTISRPAFCMNLCPWNTHVNLHLIRAAGRSRRGGITLEHNVASRDAPMQLL